MKRKTTKRPERTAVLISTHPHTGEPVDRTHYIYPPVFSATGAEFFLKRSYTQEEYECEFAVGNLVVLEKTERRPFEGSQDEINHTWGQDKFVWRLVKEEEYVQTT